MRYFILILVFGSVAFSAPTKPITQKAKDKIEEKLKEVDTDINAVDYPFKPGEKALLKYIEELEARIEALEKKSGP